MSPDTPPSNPMSPPGVPGDSSKKLRRREESRAARLAALVYVGTSLVAALSFLAVTTLTGSYSPVARYGGAVWIFILMMIVLMPLVIPRVKKWRGL